MNTPNPQDTPASEIEQRLQSAKFLSVIVRGCLWTADRLAYAVMALEARDGA